MKKIILVLCVLPLVWWLLPEQKNTSDSYKKLADVVPALMEEVAIPGLAIAKVTAGTVTILETYGEANIDKDISVTENTIFNIASISKPYVGLALLMLVEQGKLELDRNINDYLSFKVDNPKVDSEIITIRHLASHSSGIEDYYDINSYGVNKDSDISLKEHLISFLTPKGKNYHDGKYFLPIAPGTARKYSNLAAGLAGHLVEEVTGLTLAEYSKQYMFPKLGMVTSRWLLHDLDLKNVAIPYEVEQCVPFFRLCADTESQELNFLIGKYVNPPRHYKHFISYPHFGNPQYPDGGLRTSIKELSQSLALILNNTDINGKSLLSDNSYQTMFSLQLAEEVSDSQRFFWRDRNGLTGHMGSDLGVFTAMYFDIKSKTGVIVLMNRGVDAKASKAAMLIAETMMAM